MNYGRYEIVKEVGRGSMGVVYQARDPQIDRVVALKVLRPDRVSSESFVKRFLKEAKVIGRLSHPHIVTIYDVGEDQGNVYIAMEFLEGRNLSDIMREKRLSAAEVAEFGIQLAETMDYAHRKGVVHRDVKPSNIIVQHDGWIKVTDFGIAHLDDASATLQTQTGEIMGTPAYMSPEQVMGKTVDGRSDLFSIGVILYELCTGKRPFGGEGKNLATVFNEIIQNSPPEPAVTNDIPQELSGLIMKALEKEPDKRYQTGKELADTIKMSLGGQIPVMAAQPPPAKVKKKSRVIPVIIVLVSVFILLAASGGALVYYKGQGMLTSLRSRALDWWSTKTATKTKPAEPRGEQQPPAQKPVSSAAAQDQTGQPPSQGTGGESTEKPPAQATGPEEPARMASLKVASSPRRAKVFLDGELKGETPLTLSVPLGNHLVKLTRTGYLDAEKRFSLDSSIEYQVSFKLKRVAGKPATRKPAVQKPAVQKPPDVKPPIVKPPVRKQEPTQNDWIVKPRREEKLN